LLKVQRQLGLDELRSEGFLKDLPAIGILLKTPCGKTAGNLNARHAFFIFARQPRGKTKAIYLADHLNSLISQKNQL